MFVVCLANFDEIWWRLPDFNAIEFDQFDSVFYKAKYANVPNIFNYAFSLNVKQKHKIYAHYFVIMKLVSTSVSNNLNQDSFPLHPFSSSTEFSFRSTILFICTGWKKAVEVFCCCGYFAHFLRCCWCFLFFQFLWKHFFSFSKSFLHKAWIKWEVLQSAEKC